MPQSHRRSSGNKKPRTSDAAHHHAAIVDANGIARWISAYAEERLGSVGLRPDEGMMGGVRPARQTATHDDPVVIQGIGIGSVRVVCPSETG